MKQKRRKRSKIVPLFRGGADRIEFAHAQKTFRRASARGLPRCPLRGGGIPPSGPTPVGRSVQRRTVNVTRSAVEDRSEVDPGIRARG